MVESETPSISHVIDFEMHMKSAQTGADRPWEALMLVPSFTSGASKFVYTIAGSRGGQNEFHIDGIASPGEGSTSMTMEGSQELKVQAVNNGAEFSKPGIYQQVSRSGSNDPHGNIRYYHSNSVLNARSFFAASKGSGRSHSWGAWLAGPIRVPGLYNGKDKTFFTLAYEGSRSPNFSNANATVPTAAMRAGDFSAFATVRDPLSGQAFPGNRIPADRISPVSRAIQDRFYPLPNFGNVGVFAALNHRILFDNSDKFNNVDVRLDQKLHPKNTVFARYGWIQFPVKGLESSLPTIGTRSQLRNLRTGVLSDTHIFSPTAINELRIGFQRSHNPTRGPQEGLEVLRSVGIEGITNAADAHSMPTFSITGLQTLSTVNEGLVVSQQVVLSDSFTWIRRSHTVKSGIEIRRPLPLNRSIPAATYGTYSFTGALSGNAYADFLLGLPQTTTRTSPAPDAVRKRWEYGFFVQGDYKVNRRLTVQAGLRYEYVTPITNRACSSHSTRRPEV